MNWTATLAAAATLSLTAPLSVFAQDNPDPIGVSGEDLVPASTTNVVGDPITYPEGTAEISAGVVTFEKGGQTGLHQHPVPILVYVLEGELEVRVEGAEPIRMTPGQAFLEPQNRNMQAFNRADGPTRILAFTIGAQGQPSSADPQ